MVWHCSNFKADTVVVPGWYNDDKIARTRGSYQDTSFGLGGPVQTFSRAEIGLVCGAIHRWCSKDRCVNPLARTDRCLDRPANSTQDAVLSVQYVRLWERLARL